MITASLGRVSPSHKGEYNSSNIYTKLDIVSYLGSSYMVLKDTAGVTPKVGANYQLVSSVGDRGLETGYIKRAYLSEAAMIADKANIPANTSVGVTNDATGSKNGEYNYNGSTFTKSAYDPTALANTYTDSKVKDVTNNFKTKALMTASTLPKDSYAMVTDDTVDNGMYVKTAGAWVKSKYDTSAVVLSALEDTQEGYISGLATGNISFDTSTRKLVIGGTSYVHTPTYRKQLATPISLDITESTPYRIEYNASTHKIRATYYLEGIEKDWITVALFRYIDGVITEHRGLTSLTVDGKLIGYNNKPSNLADYMHDQLSSFVESTPSNLLSKHNWTDGVVQLANGTLNKDASWAVTGLIAVKPNIEYTFLAEGAYSIVYLGLYDVSGLFLRRLDMLFTQGTKEGEYYSTMTFPSNVGFIRASLRPIAISKNTGIFKGSYPVEYVEKTYSLKNITIPESLITKEVGELGEVFPYTLSNFITPSENLFNPDTSLNGMVILNDGSFKADAGYNVSGFLPVVPDEYYAVVAGATSNIPNVSFYKEGKVFKNRSGSLGFISNHPSQYEDRTVFVMQIPSAIHFLRFNYRPAATSKIAMYKGMDEIYPTPSSVPTLKNVKLDESILGELLDDSNIIVKDKITYNHPVDVAYKVTREWEGYTDVGWGTKPKASYVYSIYDALMAQYPEYITKQDLGNDAFGNPIALYKFIPKRPKTSVTVKKAKVFLTCGTHGYEHVSPLATYLMLKEMCERWTENPQLEVLRHNVDFLVIPVVNPSGWDIFSRQNANGVDINRNFPQGWSEQSPESGTYGGTEPLSELESQYIVQVFDENPDINIMYDFHNFHGTSNISYFIWVPSGSIPYVQTLCQTLCSRMLNIWRQEYDWIPNDFDYEVGYSDRTNGAMIQNYAIGRGIKLAATFELCSHWWVDPNEVPYGTIHTKTMIEALTNWILLNLEALKHLE